jgi:hypothetical protein
VQLGPASSGQIRCSSWAETKVPTEHSTSNRQLVIPADAGIQFGLATTQLATVKAGWFPARAAIGRNDAEWKLSALKADAIPRKLTAYFVTSHATDSQT